MSGQNGCKGSDMYHPDIWGALWGKTPKVHDRLVRDISYQIWTDTPKETVWTMVELAGNLVEEDILATTRALWDLQDEWRTA